MLNQMRCIVILCCTFLIFLAHCLFASVPKVSRGHRIFMEKGGLQIEGVCTPYMWSQYFPPIPPYQTPNLSQFLSANFTGMNFFGQEPVYSCIIGASGIVYMLAFFIFFSGIFRKNKTLLTVALVVALYYGSLIWGIFPEELFYKLDQPSKISWQAHLSGAIVGLALALIFKNKHREKNKKFIWEFPNYYSEKDDKLWQEYLENHPEHFTEEPKLKKDDAWDHLDEIRKK